MATEGVLLSLPDAIVISFVAEWISIGDIVRLDEAYCSRVYRDQFHRLLSAPEMVVDNPHHITTGLKWFTARGLKSSTLVMKGTGLDLPLLTEHFTTLAGNHIQSIVASDIAPHGPALMAMLSVTCNRVQQVNLQRCGSLVCLDLLLRQSRAALVSIWVENCELDNCQALDGICMHHLRCLGVSDLSADALARFLKLSNSLEDVCISQSEFDDACILRVSAPKLCMLDLVNCSGLSDGCLVRLANVSTNLKVLSLWECEGLSEASLMSFVAHCRQLTSILFTDPATDSTLIAIAEHCGPRLRHLALYDVQCTSDAGIDALAQRCTNIESLLWDSTGASMPALCGFIRAQARLVEVTLSKGEVDDSVLQAVTAHGAWLTHLGLYETTGYTEAGLLELAQLCSVLKEVCVDEGSVLVPALTQGWWQALRPNLTFNHQQELLPFWRTLWDDTSCT